MAFTVARQQIVGAEAKIIQTSRYLKSETLKAPAQNVGARHTASHSFPQPPITKVYFESRGFSAVVPP
jgi:hypothetical protein